MLALRSFDWLITGEEAARPRKAAVSKQAVSSAPRMIAAVTGSMFAVVGSDGRLAASLQFCSYDMVHVLPEKSAGHCSVGHGSRPEKSPPAPSGMSGC